MLAKGKRWLTNPPVWLRVEMLFEANSKLFCKQRYKNCGVLKSVQTDGVGCRFAYQQDLNRLSTSTATLWVQECRMPIVSCGSTEIQLMLTGKN
jgi:hypothetical protein